MSKTFHTRNCDVHINIKSKHNIDDINEKVCRSLPVEKYDSDGKHYCLLHKPDKGKPADNFEKKINERYDEVQTKVAKIRNSALSAAEENKALAKLRYDFRYVWFPRDYTFSGKTFEGVADFSSATFLGDAYFIKAKFKARAEFRFATFSADVDFEKANFFAEAFFGKATFSGDTNFRRAKFLGRTETFFNESNFAKTTIFDYTEFDSDVSFDSAVFGEDSDVFFFRSSFKGNVDFQYSIAKGLLRFSDLPDNPECNFDFQEAVFEKASRISFHTMTLHPNWFVNVDSRKFAFAEITWINDSTDLKVFTPSTWKNWRNKNKNKNIEDELVLIDNRDKRSQDKRLYEIVRRELREDNTNSKKYETNEIEQQNLTFNSERKISKTELDNLEKHEITKRFELLYLVVVHEILVNVALRINKLSYISWQELPRELKDKYIWREQDKFGKHETLEQQKLFLKSVVLKIAVSASSKKYELNEIERQILSSYLKYEDADKPDKNAEIKEELEKLETIKSDEQRNHLLEIAARNLAVNYEENNRYAEASTFRYMAMETKRLEKFWKWSYWRLSSWYRLTSKYGERWRRALFVFAIMVFLAFPCIYYFLPFETCSPKSPIGFSLQTCELKGFDSKDCTCHADEILPFTWVKVKDVLNREFNLKKIWEEIKESELQSIATATFHEPEYRRPISKIGEIFIVLEKFLAPIQLALLALAIRRKFMR